MRINKHFLASILVLFISAHEARVRAYVSNAPECAEQSGDELLLKFIIAKQKYKNEYKKKWEILDKITNSSNSEVSALLKELKAQCVLEEAAKKEMLCVAAALQATLH